jgi:hypothetical protein
LLTKDDDWMKKYLILTILFCLYLLPTYGNYTNLYINNHNSYNSISDEQTYRRIGYTTNYSNGQFNSVHYYQNTYTSNGSNRRPGQPRRIIVYSGSDDESGKNTPGGNNDSSDWLYEYDDTTKEWWCSKDGGKSWYKWDSWFGLGWLFHDWRPGRGNPTDNATHYHHDKNNPWVVPIGEPTVPLLTILLLYSVTILKKKK